MGVLLLVFQSIDRRLGRSGSVAAGFLRGTHVLTGGWGGVGVLLRFFFSGTHVLTGGWGGVGVLLLFF